MANNRMKVAEVGRERGDIMFDNVCPSFVGSSLSTAKEKCYQEEGYRVTYSSVRVIEKAPPPGLSPASILRRSDISLALMIHCWKMWSCNIPSLSTTSGNAIPLHQRDETIVIPGEKRIEAYANVESCLP